MGSRWIGLTFGLPIAVLTGALAWLAVEHRTIALWNVAVHESGRYTLGQTVLYFSHFLREIPTVIAMSLFLVASSAAGRNSRISPTRTLLGLAGAGFIIALSFALAVHEHGAGDALQNINQLYTRDDLPAYGSHWRFHFLSTIWFGLAAPVVAWLGARLFAGPPPRRPLASPLGRIAWLYFGLLTVAYGITTEPFVDPRFIGHQARELFTHALITLPLGLGVVALVSQPAATSGADVRRPSRAGLVAVFAIPVYLTIAMRLTDSVSSGQTEGGLAAMVAAHFFEHSLDYVLAGLLVTGLANAAHLTDVAAKGVRGKAVTANHVKSSERAEN